MKKNLRRLLGLAAIVFGGIYFYNLHNSPHSPSELADWAKKAGVLIAMIWLLASLSVKIMMVIGANVDEFNKAAIVSFVLLIVLISLLKGSSESSHVITEADYIFIFGWPIVDSMDWLLSGDDD